MFGIYPQKNWQTGKTATKLVIPRKSIGIFDRLQRSGELESRKGLANTEIPHSQK
jgi:hypothetical protein